MVPLGRMGAVTMVRPAAIVMENCFGLLVTPFASITCTVKLNVPVAVGVPLIVPVFGSRPIPAGGALTVTDQV